MHCGSQLGREGATHEADEESGRQLFSFATIGGALLLLGLIGLLWSLQLDTTVPSDYGGRVNNIGLLNDKQNLVIASGAVAIVGAVLVAVGAVLVALRSRR